jgi:hypothetical protein
MKELDFEEMFKAFNKIALDYLLVGGMAVNFHGIPRLTYGIDLMILLEEKNIKKLITKLQQWGYKPKLPVDPNDLMDKEKRNVWIKEKQMKAFNFFNEVRPISEVDIVLDSPVFYDELKKRSVTMRLRNVNVPTVSINDLITMKLKTGRKQDIDDVEHLKLILKTK